MRVTAAAKEATRRRILEVAQKLFAEQGFDATTTRDIARRAKIAAGTLFNYFATKEAIVEHLVLEAAARAGEQFAATQARDCPASSLEEELFAHVALILRKLKPVRKYLPCVLETSLSPLASEQPNRGGSAWRQLHLETVSDICGRHDVCQALSALAAHLYWTLFTGVLAYWISDSSPRQEDTLALLDQSMSMFAAWLTGPASQLAKG